MKKQFLPLLWVLFAMSLLSCTKETESGPPPTPTPTSITYLMKNENGKSFTLNYRNTDGNIVTVTGTDTLWSKTIAITAPFNAKIRAVVQRDAPGNLFVAAGGVGYDPVFMMSSHFSEVFADFEEIIE